MQVQIHQIDDITLSFEIRSRRPTGNLTVPKAAYTHTATVEVPEGMATDMLERAWQDTNTIYDWWGKNASVTITKEGEALCDRRWQEILANRPDARREEFGGMLRSSMVSDIFVVDGQAYIVASIGFDKIDDGGDHWIVGKLV